MERQTQGGFRFRYEVRDSPGKGLGLFALDTIPAGQIVWQFLPGLFVVHDEPTFRALLAPMTHDEAVYLFTHSFGFADLPDCVIRVLDDGALINHAVDGNLATGFDIPLQTRLDTSSPAYLGQVGRALCEDRFALWSSRTIEAGEEFTNNYSDDLCEPAFFNQLYEDYGIVEDYLD